MAALDIIFAVKIGEQNSVNIETTAIFDNGIII